MQSIDGVSLGFIFYHQQKGKKAAPPNPSLGGLQYGKGRWSSSIRLLGDNRYI